MQFPLPLKKTVYQEDEFFLVSERPARKQQKQNVLKPPAPPAAKVTVFHRNS